MEPFDPESLLGKIVEVKLCGAQGQVFEYLPRLWGSVYKLSITKASAFHNVGDVEEFLLKQIKLQPITDEENVNS